MATAKFRLEGEDATAAAFRSALGNAQGTANRMAGLFKTAFAGISVAAIAGVAAKAIETGDELNKAAIKAGLGGKAISELAHAAKMADVDLGGLSTSLRFMQKNLSEAETGGKGQIATLRALGLELKDLKGLAPDKQFELLADRIAALKDPADRARAATEWFGKAGADLLPMFEKGAAGIRAAREEAQRLGKSLDDQTIKKLADADDAIKRMKSSWEAVALTLTAKVAPALTKVFDFFSGASAKSSLSVAQREIMTELDKLSGVYNYYAGSKGEENLRKAQEVLREIAVLNGQLMRLKGGGPGPRAGAAATEAPGYEASDKSQKAIADAEKAAKELAAINKRALDDTGQMYNDLRVLSADVFKDTLDVDALLASTYTYGELWRRTADETYAVASTMTVYAKRAAENMQDAFANFLFDPFRNGLKGMLSAFIDTIRRMAAEAAAAKIFGAIGASGAGGNLGKLFSFLPGFATGGSFNVGGSGGTDSQLVAFRATPGERVDISTPGQRRGGGIVVAPVYHVDNRGATQDVIRMMPQILSEHARQIAQLTRSAVFNDLSRRGVMA